VQSGNEFDGGFDTVFHRAPACCAELPACCSAPKARQWKA
jgi:hypothetical protein